MNDIFSMLYNDVDHNLFQKRRRNGNNSREMRMICRFTNICVTDTSCLVLPRIIQPISHPVYRCTDSLTHQLCKIAICCEIPSCPFQVKSGPHFQNYFSTISQCTHPIIITKRQFPQGNVEFIRRLYNGLCVALQNFAAQLNTQPRFLETKYM